MKLPRLKVDKCAGRTFLCDQQAIALQLNCRIVVTLLNRAPIFDPPEIHPLKIVAAICEGLAGAKQRLLAIAMEDQDTEFVVGFVLHENSQVRSTIAIEIAALQEGVDPT